MSLLGGGVLRNAPQNHAVGAAFTLVAVVFPQLIAGAISFDHISAIHQGLVYTVGSSMST